MKINKILFLLLFLSIITLWVVAEKNKIVQKEFIYDKPPVWIWKGDSKADKVFFRKNIYIKDYLMSSNLTLTADGKFQLYINGVLVSENKDWTDVKNIDIKKYLKKGLNVLSVQVDRLKADNGLIVLGKFCYLTSCDEIKSDTSWLTSDIEEINWNLTNFNDSLWKKSVFHAEIDDKAWLGIKEKFRHKAPNPPLPRNASNFNNYSNILRTIGVEYKDFININLNPEYMYPINIYFCDSFDDISEFKSLCKKKKYEKSIGIEAKSKLILFEFDKEVFGKTDIYFNNQNISFTLSSGEDIAQLINSDTSQSIKYENYSNFLKENSHRAMKYLLLNRDRNDMKTSLKIKVNFSGYPVSNKGYFNSSDLLLNKIWENGVYTTRINMQNYYWDGVRRDRALWVGDFFEESITNYYSFMDYPLVKKSLLNLSFYLGENGQVRSQLGIGNANFYLLDYVSKWISTLKNYYLYSGDKEFITTLDYVIEKQTSYLSTFIDRDNLINIKKESKTNITDWSSSTRFGQVSYQQSVSYKAFLDAAYLKEIIGDYQSAKKYKEIAKKIKDSSNKLLFDESVGVYKDLINDKNISNRVTLDSNVLAVEYGLTDKKSTHSILKYISKSLSTPYGTRLINQPYENSSEVFVRNAISPLMNSHEAKIRFKNNEPNQAIDVIKKTYKSMIDYGTGTFWEFKSLNNNPETVNSSLAHGWSGNVSYVLSEEILGISPIEPGFKVFAFSPKLGTLLWVKGVVPTPKGLIGIIIKKENRGNSLRAILTFSSDQKAEIKLPLKHEINRFYINGEEISAKKNKYPLYLEKLNFSDKCLTFTLNKGGVYNISIP